MPPLRVEYAKSGRAKCALKECGGLIAKGELRVGTGSMMPGVDEISYKWRHVCCFSARQVKNMSPSVDNIEGFDELTTEHQAVIHRLVKGLCVGNAALKGLYINPLIATGPTVAEGKGAGKKKATEAAKRPRDATRAGPTGPVFHEPDVESDGTDEFEVARTQELPMCPRGVACFRTDAAHFASFKHPGTGASPSKDTWDAALVAKRPRPERAPVTSPAGGGGLPNGSGRSACPYGEACLLLTNPQHASTFTHGNAAQSKVVASPMPVPAAVHVPSVVAPMPSVQHVRRPGATPCPYGAMCLKTDAAHLAQYVHGLMAANMLTDAVAQASQAMESKDYRLALTYASSGRDLSDIHLDTDDDGLVEAAGRLGEIEVEALSMINNHETAIECGVDHCRAFPQRWEAHFALSRAYQRARRVEEAAEAIGKAFLLNNRSTTVRVAMTAIETDRKLRRAEGATGAITALVERRTHPLSKAAAPPLPSEKPPAVTGAAPTGGPALTMWRRSMALPSTLFSASHWWLAAAAAFAGLCVVLELVHRAAGPAAVIGSVPLGVVTSVLGSGVMAAAVTRSLQRKEAVAGAITAAAVPSSDAPPQPSQRSAPPAPAAPQGRVLGRFGIDRPLTPPPTPRTLRAQTPTSSPTPPQTPRNLRDSVRLKLRPVTPR